MPFLLDLFPAAPEALDADGLVLLGMDLTPPWVVSAQADGLSHVLVTFSEAMAADPDILDPAQWAVIQIVGAVPQVIVSASLSADGITATLTLAANMLYDTIYRVTAPANCEDLAGNLIDPAGRVAEFVTPAYAQAESGDILFADPHGGHMEQDLGLPFYELLPWAPTSDHVTLREACWLCLLSDRRAAPDDVLPDDRGPLPNKGGWWADQYLPTAGDRYGSRLWLSRARGLTQEALQEARSFAEEALQPLITEGLCARVEVLVEAQDGDRLALQVVCYKQDGQVEPIKFPDLWGAIGL